MDDKALDEFESTLWWASDDCPWTRTPPIPEPEKGQPVPRDKDGVSMVGRFAVFPKVPHVVGNTPEAKAKRQKIEDDWEKRSIAMHEAQQPLTPLAEKPQEIVPKYHEIKTERGD